MLMQEQDLEADVGQVFTSNRFIFSRLNELDYVQRRSSYRHPGITHRVYGFVLPRVKQLRLRLWNIQTQ